MSDVSFGYAKGLPTLPEHYEVAPDTVVLMSELKQINEPILITGAARSGTSLVAGIVARCGAWGGVMVNHSQWNPRGFYENGRLRREVDRECLKRGGYDPMGQKPLPDIDNLPEFDIKGKVLSVIKEQGYIGGHWFYKSPKACLIWPLYDKAFPKAKWIVVKRDTEQIVDSCIKARFMRAYGAQRKGWRQWVAVHNERMEEIKNNCINVAEVWSQDIIEGKFDAIRRSIKDYGLDWNYKDIKGFVAPELYHRKK